MRASLESCKFWIHSIDLQQAAVAGFVESIPGIINVEMVNDTKTKPSDPRKMYPLSRKTAGHSVVTTERRLWEGLQNALRLGLTFSVEHFCAQITEHLLEPQQFFGQQVMSLMRSSFASTRIAGEDRIDECLKVAQEWSIIRNIRHVTMLEYMERLAGELMLQVCISHDCRPITHSFTVDSEASLCLC